MDPTLSFGDFNSGSQIGINYGLITNEFCPPFSRLLAIFFRAKYADYNMDLDEKLPMVHEAAFDSYTDQHQDKCLPGTRTEILRQIREWASSSQGQCIFWLNGMAGTGKSTICRTVAESFSQAKLLGASFFFKRGEADRGNATKLFPTIAGQLASSLPQLAPNIRKAVQDNPGISMKGIEEQFTKLLLQPFASLKQFDHAPQTAVIVIDALDECGGEKDIRLILQLLPQLQELNAVRLRVFVTSRPELPIRLGFKKLADVDHKDLILHETLEEAIEHDISLFLKHRLSEIREEREPPLPISWPGTKNFKNLLALSVPLFIFAATVCRIFEDPDWDPEDSLTEILTHQNDESKLAGLYLPLLDMLLHRQREKHQEQMIQEFQQVVGTLLVLESPLSAVSLSSLLGLSEITIHLRLNPLRSVLSVPDDESLPIRLFHQSFRDFLLDPEAREKTPFWQSKTQLHHNLATKCIRICQNLRKNICGLPSDGTRRAQIDRETIDRCIPLELQYACRYWVHHLVQCKESGSVMGIAFMFLQKHFLHWAEAMCLLGSVSGVFELVNILQTAIRAGDLCEMSAFLEDAKRFILKTRQIADEAPLQLYCSGLVFAPPKAMIRKLFHAEIPSWIFQLPYVEESWDAELQALHCHADWVESVKFSPDGRILASGSRDMTVRLWDARTGVLHQILEGHSSSVLTVTFSPDGQLLATGSDDGVIKLWDTKTGSLQQTMQGHFGWILTVVFSSDSRLLASGSDDGTVLLWDITTGCLQQTHEGSGLTVAFSSDGRLLVSGSTDRTIRIWDIATNDLLLTLEGHASWVQSVAFSSNDQFLASSSRDKTVRIWEIATGTCHQTLNVNGIVTDLKFSQDGSYLCTNLGSFDTRSRCENFPRYLPRLHLDISIKQGKWIALNGQKALWLPSEYRPYCSAVKENTLALGHTSGEVSIIGFRI